jgi:hypothetical protein
MEREQLDRLIRTPRAVDRQDMPALRELSERAPWFAGVQLLRMVGERTFGDVRSDGGLQSAAAHIPSRAVLHELVEPPQRAMEERRPSPLLEVVRDDKAQPAFPEPVSTEQPERTGPTTAPPTAEPEAAHGETDGTIAVPEPATTKPEDEADAMGGTASVEGMTIGRELAGDDPLERQILESALASIYDLTLHSAAQGSDVKTAGKAPVPVSLSVPAPTPMREVPAAAVTPPLPPAEPQERLARPASGRLRFTAWLSHEVGQAVAPSAEPSSSAGTEPPKVVAGGGPAERQPPPPSPIDAGALIDRFIQQETPPPTRKATFFTPQQAARKSLDDSAGLVTETLARIYAKQGNLQKAIDAYGKLALKYPEKSAYFAALSRSLEEQLNS